VFLDPDFLHDAGIPAIRKHLRQKMAYLCLHGFFRTFWPKVAVSGGKIGKGWYDVDPNELDLTFGEYQSRNAIVRVQTE